MFDSRVKGGVVLFFCLYMLKVSLAGKQNKSGKKSPTMGGSAYTGEWDISARETATLCAAAEKMSPTTRMISESGDEVLVSSNDVPEPERSTYLREDKKCWKNEWVPCGVGGGDVVEDRMGSEGVLARRRRPCGHYRMVKAPPALC